MLHLYQPLDMSWKIFLKLLLFFSYLAFSFGSELCYTKVIDIKNKTWLIVKFTMQIIWFYFPLVNCDFSEGKDYFLLVLKNLLRIA